MTTPTTSARKTAIVTGAGSGVGRAATLALLRSGFQVVLAGRRREALEETARLAGEEARHTLVVPTNVSEEASVEALFTRARETYPHLDLLFNNAGTNVPAVPLEDLSAAQWREVLDVNLTGAFLATRAAFRWMKQQDPMGGRIINNGSVSAHVPRPNSAPYTASKHAITGLTRSTALDGRPFRIACGQIDIGNAETPMAAKMKSGVLQADGRIATEPTMDVEHVARAVVHMAELPLDANILFVTVMATNMPLVGRG